MLLKPVVALLWRLAMRLEFFLDDSLIMNQMEGMSWRDKDTALFVLQRLGFIINWIKSELQPKYSIEFWGFLMNSVEMTLSLPVTKIFDICSCCQDFLRFSSTSVRHLAAIPLKSICWHLPELVALMPAAGFSSPTNVDFHKCCHIQISPHLSGYIHPQLQNSLVKILSMIIKNNSNT